MVMVMVVVVMLVLMVVLMVVVVVVRVMVHSIRDGVPIVYAYIDSSICISCQDQEARVACSPF